MKKIFTLLFTLCAFAINGNAAMWLVGDAFNGWEPSESVQMTQDGTTYTYEATLTAGKFFAFFKDSQAWDSQRGPQTNDAAPSGDWESTQSGGAWKVATTGEYTIEYNYSTDQAKIALKTVTPFDDTTRKFAVTGAAFGGWNMPPSSAQTFTNNGDGTYTLVYEGATAGLFKLSGVGESDTFDTSWSVFNGGCYGKSGLVEGDNTLTTSFGTDNMTFPVNGDVTLTISNVTETGCTLNIARNASYAPSNFYILGLNGWHPNSGETMTLSGNTYTYTGDFYGQDDDYYAYFSFTSALGSSDSDWEGIAGSRWGADSNDLVVTAGSNYNVSAGTNAFKVLEGNYTISVEFTSATTATLTVVRNGDATWPTAYLRGNFNGTANWDPGLSMTHQGNGIYTLSTTLTQGDEVKIYTDDWYGSASWDDTNSTYYNNINFAHHADIPLTTSNGSNFYVDVTGTYNVTLNWRTKSVTFEKEVSTYSVIGAAELFGGEGWDSDLDLTEAGTGTGLFNATTGLLYLAAGDYEYKGRSDHGWDWYQSEYNQTLTIDAAGFYTVTFSLDTSDYSLLAVATAVEESVEKNTAGMGTYVLQNPVDLGATISNNSGLAVYKVSSFSSEEVVMTGLTTGYLPAGTPLILEYTGSGSISLALTTEETTEVSGNLLKAGTDAYPSGTGPFYILQKPEGTTEAKFYKLTSGRAVATNRAYLDAADKSTASNAPLQAGQKVIGIDGGDLTGIDALDNSANAGQDNAATYDLSGRTVNGKLPKGVYVKNGKKFIVK